MMKKTLFVIILIAVFSLHYYASAQEVHIEWSESVGVDEMYGMREIGSDDEFYYHVGFTGSLNKTYYVMRVSKSTQKSTLRKIAFEDDKGKGCWDNQEFDMDETATGIIKGNIMMLEGKMMVFSRKKDKKAQTINLYACTLNKELKPESLPHKVASFPDSYVRPIMRSFKLLKVGNKILIRYPGRDQQSNQIISTIIDKDLRVLTIKEIGEEDPTEERLLDEKGNLVIIKGYAESGSIDYKVIKYDRVSGEASFSMVSIPDIHSCSIKSLLDSNNTLCLVAYYFRLTPDQKEMQGFYLINCDLNSMKEVSRKQLTSSNEVLDKYNSAELKFNTVIKNGTHIYLLMQKEYFNQVTITYSNNDFNSPGGPSHSTVSVLQRHYDDIEAFCIDTEKEIITWAKSIHKQQQEPLFFRFMCSYLAVVKDQQLYILFNADASEAAKNIYTTPRLKEKVALMCITINQEGELKAQQLTAPSYRMVMATNEEPQEGLSNYKVGAYKYTKDNMCSNYAHGIIYIK